jgi:uncharacterized protein YrzB (UPF0473 family)
MDEKDKFDETHTHDHEGCGCGCGHDHDHDHGEMETVMITFDDDTDVECAVLGIFGAEGREYIALIPIAEEAESPLGNEEVLVYRYAEENGEAALTQIESDEEYEAVSEAFHDMMEDDEEDDEEE